MKENIKKTTIKHIIDNQVKDYGNQQFFIDKAKKSKAFLDKNGFPKELLDKRVSAQKLL